MKIRYLLDGMSQISDDTLVLAEGDAFFFIAKNEFTLLGINKRDVVVKAYDHADDDPPRIVKYIISYNRLAPIEAPALDIEYHLPTMDNIN